MSLITTTRAIVSNADTAQAGDFTDLQSAIDYVNSLGGGTVFIRNGTYDLTADITFYNNISLLGESSDGVILDFGAMARQLLIEGSNAYIDGSIAVTDGSAAVVGTDTAWTEDMIGQSMLIRDSWYEITAVADANNLTLISTYSGDDLTGEVYAIADPISNIRLENITAQNSTATGGAISIQYIDGFYGQKMSAFDSTLGLNFSYFSGLTVRDWLVINCSSGVSLSQGGLTLDQGFVADITTGDGIDLTNVTNSQISNFSVINCAGNGVTLNACTNAGILNFNISSNTLIGIEQISCVELNFVAGIVFNNGSDGYKLTSGNLRNTITNFSIRDNGGWGINVAAGSDVNNLILGNILGSNSSGAVTDSGTTTKIRSNIGQADN